MRLPRFCAIQRSCALLAGALFMTWPALYNRYPLLYPDSMSYLEDGRLVARAVFLHKFSADYGGRSFLYCLGILPFHSNVTPWPIVALNAVLTATVLWLVVRSISPQQTVMHYLALTVALSLFTGLGWFVSIIMPDILGPVLYLCIYLLVFAREGLSRGERLTLILTAWWAVASHVTHLMLAGGLCLLFLALSVFRRSMRQWLAGIVEVAVIVLIAAAAHLALHAFLYGEPSLNGKRAPFLMARVIADGPGRLYLQQHCGDMNLMICHYLPAMPNDANEFLWNLDGIWQQASPATRKRLRAEEGAFVLATLKAYPRQQLFVSATNFRNQLVTFGLWDYGPNQWVSDVFDRVLPGARANYLKSRQAQRALPDEFSSSAQEWAVVTALVLIGALMPFIWRRGRPRIFGLAAVIVFVVIANAFVTGVLANVEDRYQGRVIWLVPLLAAAFVMEWRGRDDAATAAAAETADQSRKARAGSVRVARQAGKKHAANEPMVITARAAANASGSRGLTLYRRFCISRVNPSATAAPRKTPPAVKAKPRDNTSRHRCDAPAPSAMRRPNSRVLCDTA